MSLILVPVWLLLQVQPGNDTEPVHAGNPVYVDAIRSGFHADGATIRFPGPILKDGLDANQQHAALLKLSGSERALADLLRDSVTAPFLLKVRDQKMTDATVRIVDLWFVVRGDLASLDPVEVASQASGKAVEAGNMRFASRLLTDDELKPRGRSSHRGRDLSRWFVHLEGRLLDRIAVEATNEAVATRTEESMVIAGRTDPVFDSDTTLANRWRTLGQDGQAGSGHPFRGALSYAKISRLKQPPGSLLVEFHGAFSEPEAWFQGNPILRSKFAPIAQDQIRRLRRELLKNGPNSALPAPNA
ncbi:MAG: hypothetical protein ABSE84_25825, partial [Isosphaeraceae bacterium]